MPEMAFKVVDDLVIVVHSGQAPLKDEWSKYVQEHEKLKSGGRKVAILVFTSGGGPDSTQRSALRQAVPNAPITAVVSRNVLVRGIVTAFNWLGWGAMQAFAPAELEGALSFVQTKVQGARVLAEVDILQKKLTSQVQDLRA